MPIPKHAPSSLPVSPEPALFDRRGFLTTAGALAVSSLLTAACGSDGSTTGPGGTPPLPAGVSLSGSTLQIDLAVATGLAPVNGYLIVSQPATIVLHLGNDEFRAFTAVCTHSGCLVANFTDGRINCVCHGSQFDTLGNVVRSPATRPLRTFPATFNAQSGTVQVITS